MKGIIRIKNGYKEMKINEPKCGDIKYNVIFEDQQISIIAAIQFAWLYFLIDKQTSVDWVSFLFLSNPLFHTQNEHIHTLSKKVFVFVVKNSFSTR